MREANSVNGNDLAHRELILNYAAEHGNESAAGLLLLFGPDGYNGDDYDELLKELEEGAEQSERFDCIG